METHDPPFLLHLLPALLPLITAAGTLRDKGSKRVLDEGLRFYTETLASEEPIEGSL